MFVESIETKQGSGCKTKYEVHFLENQFSRTTRAEAQNFLLFYKQWKQSQGGNSWTSDSNWINQIEKHVCRDSFNSNGKCKPLLSTVYSFPYTTFISQNCVPVVSICALASKLMHSFYEVYCYIAIYFVKWMH